MYKKAILPLMLAASFSLAAQVTGFQYRTVGPIDTKTITGAPYSATAKTTFTQTLADGTRITRTTTALVARDSQGRTRREETISALGPLATSGSEKHLITINDPVSQSHYVLLPDQQVATKGPVPSITALGLPEIKAGAVVRQTQTKASTSRDNVGWIAKEGTLMIMESAERNGQMEDLGDQVIEGVRAHGRREKHTIAVGEIGNDRPIEVSSETWFSNELKTIVLSKRSDPRMGDSEYRLTNISLVEPGADLFEVPAGYTIRENSEGPLVIERKD